MNVNNINANVVSPSFGTRIDVNLDDGRRLSKDVINSALRFAKECKADEWKGNVDFGVGSLRMLNEGKMERHTNDGLYLIVQSEESSQSVFVNVLRPTLENLRSAFITAKTRLSEIGAKNKISMAKIDDIE